MKYGTIDSNTFKQPMISSIILQQYRKQHYLVTSVIINILPEHTHSGMYVYIYILTCMHVCHIHITHNAHKNIHMYVHVYVHTHARMHTDNEINTQHTSVIFSSTALDHS